MSGVVSTVTLAEVRRWDPHGLDTAARALRAARDELEQLRSRLRAARPGRDPVAGGGGRAGPRRARHPRHEAAAAGGPAGQAVPVFTTAAADAPSVLDELRRTGPGGGRDRLHHHPRRQPSPTPAIDGDARRADRSGGPRGGGRPRSVPGWAGCWRGPPRIDAALLTVLQRRPGTRPGGAAPPTGRCPTSPPGRCAGSARRPEPSFRSRCPTHLPRPRNRADRPATDRPAGFAAAHLAAAADPTPSTATRHRRVGGSATVAAGETTGMRPRGLVRTPPRRRRSIRPGCSATATHRRSLRCRMGRARGRGARRSVVQPPDPRTGTP